MELSDVEQQELLTIAKSAIISAAKGEKTAEPESENKNLTEPGAAFVTIEKNGRLRGCIGYMEAVAPLDKTVRDMAESAARHDPRFPPVEESELKDLTVEITVLSPLKKIDSVEEIRVGTHGIWIENGYNRGVLLPQVAVDYGWDRETFLRHTAMKAGLHPESWKDSDTVIKIFSGLIFGNEPVMK